MALEWVVLAYMALTLLMVFFTYTKLANPESMIWGARSHRHHHRCAVDCLQACAVSVHQTNARCGTALLAFVVVSRHL